MSTTLHLSVINTGTTYQERMKLARNYLGEFSLTAHIKALRPIVNGIASIERVQFKSKFTATDISEACREVAKYDRQSIIEDMAALVASGGTIYAQGRKWFDSVNGNTYHSVRMTVAGYSVYLPMQYGYGDQWQHSAQEWLIENEIVPNPGKYSNGMRKPFTHKIEFTGGAYGLKRDL